MAERDEAFGARMEALAEQAKALRASIAEQDKAFETRMQALAEQDKALRASIAEQDQAFGVRMEALDRRLDQIAEEIQKLIGITSDHTLRIGELAGWSLEDRYWKHAFSYFGRILGHLRALTPDEVSDLVYSAFESGALTRDEAYDIGWADVIARGRGEDGSEAYVVAEVSVGVGLDDVLRAAARAKELEKVGVRSIPVVAGKRIIPEAAEKAATLSVWQVTGGQTIPPPA